MSRVTYIEPNGDRRTFAVPAGLSVMEGAVRNGVAGIAAECGGACSCATCLVYVDDVWLAKIGPMSSTEAVMLEFTEVDAQATANGRLSCQVKMTEALDGLVVRIPEEQ